MAGIELVADQRTRAPFPRGAPELSRVHREAYKARSNAQVVGGEYHPFAGSDD